MLSLYINGVRDATLDNPQDVSSGSDLLIGKDIFLQETNFYGRIDELRFSDLSRPAAWLGLCYANQKPGSRMVTIE